MPKIATRSVAEHRLNKLDHRNCDGLIYLASRLASDENMSKLSLNEKIKLLNMLKTIERRQQILQLNIRKQFRKQLTHMLWLINTR